MRNITADALVSSIDATEFANKAHETIGKFQSKGWSVEVQYQTAQYGAGQVMYSAFIIAREGDENNEY